MRHPGRRSALVPGLGQALAGRFRDAAMLLVTTLWLRAFIASHVVVGPDGSVADRRAAFAFGAPAIDGGLRVPLLGVFTGLLLAVPGRAAWSALRQAAQNGPYPRREGSERGGVL